MRCITIQHKEVYETLKNGKIYRANYNNVNESFIKPYKFMQDYFKWKSTPIFLSPEEHYVEMAGAKFTENSIAIELDIPEECVKIQRYYDWSDFIYFSNEPWEFDNASNIEQFDTVEDWGKTILNIKDNIEVADKFKDPIQATVEIILPEWIIGVSYDITKLEVEHNDSSGRNKLKKLKYYM